MNISRDGSRAPLWRDAPLADFSVAPWMPVGGDIALNLTPERQQQDETSFWHQYRLLIVPCAAALRRCIRDSRTRLTSH
ncbi:hypothetical protein [Enterobacter sp. RHBSTW-01064]|uniref:hypothetical protein n=1 Tax=Enterobacter sp. RHBSTW-01064 TaxID=2742679 RepID=UPI002016C435|nr:hypothetical protein [Enterobacter sp. RHBSTW-01064]